MDLFTYLMAKKGQNTGRDLFSYLLGKKASGGSGTYTTFSGTSLNISNTIKAAIKKFMLNSAELTQDGTPTPDNPVDVNVITGSNNIKISNSDNTEEQNYPITLSSDNLLNLPTKLVKVTKNGLTFTPVYIGNALLYINVNGTATADTDYYVVNTSNRLTLPAGSYLFSSGVDGSNNTYFMNLSARNLAVISNYSGNTSLTINNSDDFWFLIKVRNGTTVDNVKFKPFMRVSTSTSEYAPYIANPLEYCKIGDYADQIFKNTSDSEFYDSTLLENEWYLKKNIGKKFFKDVAWTYYSASICFYASISDIYIESSSNVMFKGFCNIYNKTTSDSLVAWRSKSDLQIGMRVTTNKIIVKDSNYTDATTFKNARGNDYFYYVLATPQYIHISETDYPILRSQLENLYNNAKSYNGQTNITQTNDGLPFNISVDVKVS